MPRPLSATSKIAKPSLVRPRTRDIAGHARLEIFERVIDQVGKNLLQREAVGDDVRQRLDANLGLGFRSLMRDGGDNGFDQFAGIDPHRLELAPSLAGEIEDRR